MRVYRRDVNADANWSPVAIILIVLLIALTMTYFL